VLKSFTVSGYKNFDQPVTIDFSDVGGYQFSNSCINNGLLGKVIIYGKNASGKSNFARALMDICTLLSKSTKMEDDDGIYINIYNTNGYAEFKYVFIFDDTIIEYIYRKTAPLKLIYERLSINGDLLFHFDRSNPQELKTQGLKRLNPTLIIDFINLENVDSALSYIIANTPLNSKHYLRKLNRFIESMFLDSFSEKIYKIGNVFSKHIVENEELLLGDLGKLLRLAGIRDELIIKEGFTGEKKLYFNTTPLMPFAQAASSGTKALCFLSLLYSVGKHSKCNDPCLVILDEFDAFYHHELAEHIVKMFLELPNVQVVFTSHNTSLLSNRYMRPDCFFIMTQNKLTSFANATQRELREGHNLEKLFMSGEFDEQE